MSDWRAYYQHCSRAFLRGERTRSLASAGAGALRTRAFEAAAAEAKRRRPCAARCASINRTLIVWLTAIALLTRRRLGRVTMPHASRQRLRRSRCSRLCAAKVGSERACGCGNAAPAQRDHHALAGPHRARLTAGAGRRISSARSSTATIRRQRATPARRRRLRTGLRAHQAHCTPISSWPGMAARPNAGSSACRSSAFPRRSARRAPARGRRATSWRNRAPERPRGRSRNPAANYVPGAAAVRCALNTQAPIVSRCSFRSQRQPLYTIGGHMRSSGDDLRCVADGTSSRSCRRSRPTCAPEAVLGRNPDVIIAGRRCEARRRSICGGAGLRSPAVAHE